jgi:hypothetical protein
MRRPLLLFGCITSTPEDGGYQRWLRSTFREAGYAVDVVFKHDPADAIRRYCFSGPRRPDVLLLAAEGGTVKIGGNSSLAEIVIDDVRGLSDVLCFPGRVRAKTIPIVLAAYGSDPFFHHKWKDRDLSRKWCRAVRDEHRLHDSVKGAVRDWRRDLLGELEYIGYAITRDQGGQFNVSHAAVRRRRGGDILADDASLAGLRKAGYYLLESDILDDLPAFRELEGLLSCFRHVADVEGVQPEAVLQRFFERNPHMMLEDEFGEIRSKMRIPRRDGGDPWQPDFAGGPVPDSVLHTRAGFIDLKLPDAPVTNRKRLHRGFSAEVHQALDQLEDYREEVANADDRARAFLMKRYGFVPDNPKQAVIIGRRPSDPNSLEALYRRRKNLPLDVRVIVYDDILDDEEDRILLQYSLGVRL